MWEGSEMRSKLLKAANGTTLGDHMQGKELEKQQEEDQDGVSSAIHPHTTHPRAGAGANIATDMSTCQQHAGRILLTMTAKD